MEESKKDAIKFFKLMGFIEICHEHDFESGPDETINEYNQTVIEIQELAKKYGLYDEKKDMNDPWYDLYTLWPKMKEFFKEILNYENIGDKCIRLLDELNERCITQEEMTEICNIFPGGKQIFDNGSFAVTPKLIKNTDDLIKFLKKHTDKEDQVEDVVRFFKFCKIYREKINLFKDEYWMYIDGINWELQIETQNGMISYLKAGVECEEMQTKLKLLETLQKLTKVNDAQ